MTTHEIYQFIKNLEPENESQVKVLKKLLRVIEKSLNEKPNDRTQTYIDTLERDAIVNKEVGVVYSEYCEWCKNIYFIPIERSIFSKRICESLNVLTRVVKINKKSKRIYY